MRHTITYLSIIVISLLAGCTNSWSSLTRWREQYPEAAAVCQGYVRTDHQMFPHCMSVSGGSNHMNCCGMACPDQQGDLRRQDVSQSVFSGISGGSLSLGVCAAIN